MTEEPRDPAADVSPGQKSALLLLFVTFFIDILGVGLVLPLNAYYVQRYPLFLGRRMDPGLAIGILTASYPLLQFVFAPFWGRLSDRVGRRPIILLSLLGNSLAWLLFGLARSFEMLLLARSLSGVLSSASLPTVQAYIADSTPPAKRSIWIGIVVGMGFSFGFMLGPPIAGFLGTSPWPAPMAFLAGLFPGGAAISAADHLSWPAFLAAIIAFVNFLAALRLLPESLAPEVRARVISRAALPLAALKTALSQPQIARLLVVLWLANFAMQSLEQTIAIFGNRDVTRSSRSSSWTGIEPRLLKGHEVYSVRYSPDTPPPGGPDELRQSLAEPVPGQQGGVEPDDGLPGGTILVRRHLIQEDTGILLLLVAFIVGMIQGGGLRKLVPRFGEIQLIAAGCIVAAVGFFLIPAASGFLALLGAAAVAAAGFSLINPCLRGLISVDTEAESQGSVLGLTQSVNSLAMAAGPLLGGWLFDRGAGYPFFLGGACMIVAAVVGVNAGQSSAAPE